MIFDWKTVWSACVWRVSGPIGDPWTARTSYMRVFIALERAALMRMGDDDLKEWAEQEQYGVRFDAQAEQLRRSLL